MDAVNITVEVHCLKPTWVNYETNKYRIYINDNLLTERSWIWPLTTYISEDIWVTIPTNNCFTVRIDPVIDTGSVAKFAIRNLKLIKVPYTSNQFDDLLVSVTLL
jgi:hypothetical protein